MINLTNSNVGNWVAQNNLKAFAKRINKKYTFNWHHEILADRLEAFVKSDKPERLMIFAPPQTGKSEMTSRIMPAFALGRNPDEKIGITSYSDTIASGFNRAIQNNVLSSEFKLIFPECRMSQRGTKRTSEKVYKRQANLAEIIGYDGFVKSTGVRGSLTGTPLDLAIIDDPLKDRKEAMSDSIRDDLWNWYTDVLSTRLHNGSKILLMMTRWHDDDLAGKILEVEKGWDVLKFQALKTDQDLGYVDPREIDDALWEEKHSKERMQSIKDKTPETFDSMYQQEPNQLEGNIIKDEHIYSITAAAVPPKVWGLPYTYFSDTSYTSKKKNDPNGLLRVKTYNNRLYIFDFIAWRQDATEALDTFIDILTGDNQTGILHIENKASGLSYIDLLITRGITAMEYKNMGIDKEASLRYIKEYLMSRQVVFVDGPYLDAFAKKLKKFPKVKHDEEIDTLVMAVVTELINAIQGQRRIGG